jgi:hypothetical protein
MPSRKRRSQELEVARSLWENRLAHQIIGDLTQLGCSSCNARVHAAIVMAKAACAQCKTGYCRVRQTPPDDEPQNSSDDRTKLERP